MQYIPIAAVPMTNTRGPQTTLLQRGREGEHQVEDHRNKCLHKTESEHLGRRGRRTDVRFHAQQEDEKKKKPGHLSLSVGKENADKNRLSDISAHLRPRKRK